MKITICGSITSTPKIKELSDKLIKMGYETELPHGSNQILENKLSMDEFNKQVAKGEGAKRKIENDVIRDYFQKIKDSDAILIVNIDKNEIKNYIGGNTFLEIGFAHVLNKKVYLLNAIPKISYSDEIKAIQPIILNNDLSKISPSEK